MSSKAGSTQVGFLSAAEMQASDGGERDNVHAQAVAAAATVLRSQRLSMQSSQTKIQVEPLLKYVSFLTLCPDKIWVFSC